MACIVVGKAAELTALKRNENTLDTSIGETFRSRCPVNRNLPIRGARWRNGSRRAERRRQGGLLPALQALVQARNVAPGTSVQALSFRQGTVDMKLAAQDAASLDRMSQSLQSHGWQADLTSGNTISAGYEGRIQLSGK